MNAFTAIIPDERASLGPAYDVNLYQAPDEGGWIAESDALPLATEAATIDALIERVWEIAPEIAELNGRNGELNLHFVLRTSARA